MVSRAHQYLNTQASPEAVDHRIWTATTYVI